MAKRVDWSPEAHVEKQDILSYWIQRLGSKTYSRKLNKAINDTVDGLALYPQLGKKLEGEEGRYFIKEYHLLFYIERADSIYITHIWDTRRNPEDLKNLLVSEAEDAFSTGLTQRWKALLLKLERLPVEEQNAIAELLDEELTAFESKRF